MPYQPTRFSVLSTGYRGSSTTLAEDAIDFSCTVGRATSNFSVDNTLYAGNLSLGTANGATLYGAIYSTFTFDPGSQAANVTSLASRAVTGLTTSHIIFMNVGSSCSANFNVNAYCESNGSLVYELGNAGAATQDLSVVTAKVLAFRVA